MILDSIVTRMAQSRYPYYRMPDCKTNVYTTEIPATRAHDRLATHIWLQALAAIRPTTAHPLALAPSFWTLQVDSD